MRRDGEKDKDKNSKHNGPSAEDTELRVKIHFDEYMSKWDEFYGEPEWEQKKLLPLHTEVKFV